MEYHFIDDNVILNKIMDSDYYAEWVAENDVPSDALLSLLGYAVEETEDWCDAYYDQAVSNAVQDTKAAMRAKTYHFIDCGIQLGSERQKSISDFCAWEVEDMRTTLERESVK